MSQITTSRVRNWATLTVALLLVGSLVAWFVQRDRLSPTIRIAAGVELGLYQKVGATIADSLEDRLGRKVEVLETAGSAENFRHLNDNEAELAIIQGGSVRLEDVSVVTPLFREFVFVVVRKGSEIESVWQLAGKKVSLGAIGSGNRDAALKVLRHFGIEETEIEGEDQLPFTSLADDHTMDAAIVTAGIEHPSLKAMLSTNEYDIVPIRSAMAMEMVHPFVRNVEVPRGLFAEHPAVPIESIPTIATTAYLVCRNDAPEELVEAVLGTIHEESLRLKVPTLIARDEATKWTATRMHPTAQRYFNPEDNMGVIVGVMESLVATKELLFAIGAGIYLIWIRWRQLKEREQQVVIDRQKEHLDRLLTKTLEIEKSQMRSDDYEQLLGYLDSVTKIKLQALQELTEEELRGNRMFSILLNQCANLISKIQFKIHLCRSHEHPEENRS